jgi:heat shock protein HspQ
MKFKLNDRVSWSIFNLTGTVIDILSNIVYIKWDEGNHTISYNTFECRNMEVMSLELFKVGDRVTDNSRNKGVITSIDKYVLYPCLTTYFKWDDDNEILPTKIDQSTHSEIWIKWDGINEPYSYKDTLNFHLDTSPVLTTKEADKPVFKVGDSVLSRDYKYSGVVTNVGFSNCISIKWGHHDSELFYSNTSDINSLIPVLANKEADTTLVFKVGDRIAHKKSSNKGVIISNYRTTLLVVQWDGSSEYFYISPKDLTLNNSIVATNDKLKVTLEVDITLNVKDELFNVAEQMVSILVKHKDYDSAKQLLECIELLNNLTKPK